jgi:hypothetical protein
MQEDRISPAEGANSSEHGRRRRGVSDDARHATGSALVGDAGLLTR